MEKVDHGLHKKECAEFAFVLGHNYTQDLWAVLANLKGLEDFFRHRSSFSFQCGQLVQQASKDQGIIYLLINTSVTIANYCHLILHKANQLTGLEIHVGSFLYLLDMY